MKISVCLKIYRCPIIYSLIFEQNTFGTFARAPAILQLEVLLIFITADSEQFIHLVTRSGYPSFLHKLISP